MSAELEQRRLCTGFSVAELSRIEGMAAVVGDNLPVDLVAVLRASAFDAVLCFLEELV